MTARIGDDTAEPVPSFEVGNPAEPEDNGGTASEPDDDKSGD